MKITDIKAGDTLCSTDKHGTGYYRVLKVRKVTLKMLCENGNTINAYPHGFERKVTYPVAAFDGAAAKGAK